MDLKKINNQIITGLICIGVSFVILMVLAYGLMRTHRQAVRMKDSLQGQVLALNAERVVAERKAKELESRVGQEIVLDASAVARERGDEDNRTQGDLWIDRALNTWTVTLGLVNGLDNGHRLTVYDGDEKIGSVAVVEVFDVIALVAPVDDENVFSKDLYRVVFEE